MRPLHLTEIEAERRALATAEGGDKPLAEAAAAALAEAGAAVAVRRGEVAAGD